MFLDRLRAYLVIAKFLLETHPRLVQARNLLALYALFKISATFFGSIRDHGLLGLIIRVLSLLKSRTFSTLKTIPYVQAKIDKEIGTTIASFEKSMLGTTEERAKYNKFVKLPKKGLTAEEVLKELELCEAMTKTKYEDGKFSGAIYKCDTKLTQLQVTAMAKFVWSNPLHPDMFPGVRKMESEIVAMVVDMFNGSSVGACGTTSSGGTESILLACRAHKEWGRHTKGITKPHMIVPVTAHAAFDKAADYFGIRITHIPLDSRTFKVDVNKLRKAITSNTVMIVGSAPNYPHGNIDDIEELSKIALRYNIGLHVDCCLGSFVIACMEEAGYPIPPFDFRLPGVTSISCDPHKYGFAPKGTSVIMYRTPALRSFQYFSCTDWPGGVYASPTIAGSRPGALLVGCWATMMYHGRQGYVESARSLVSKQKILKEAITEIPEIRLMGDPQAAIISWTSDVFDIYRLSGALEEKGWKLSNLQFPPGIHLSITDMLEPSQLIEDIKEAMKEIRKNLSAPATGGAAMYGVAAKIPDRSLINKLATGFIDTMFKLA